MEQQQGKFGRETERGGVIGIHQSDENEGVEPVGESQAEDSNDEANRHSKYLPLAHLGQLLEEPSHQVEQVSCQEPYSDIVDSFDIDESVEFLLRERIPLRVGWLKKE